MKEIRAKKVEKLRAILGDPKGSLSNIPSLPLPLDPTKHVCRILPGMDILAETEMLYG